MQVSVNKSSRKILPLTSLRFFAALYVVVYHTSFPYTTFWHEKLKVSFGWLDLGYSAVSFFFILSGYILSIVYLPRSVHLDRRGFWVARFARVYPLFVFTLILDTPQLLYSRIFKYGLTAAIAKTCLTFVANLLMLQAWVLVLRGIDDPNWSLAVETVFYILFPWLGVYIWKLSLKRAAAYGCVAYFLSLGLVIAAIRAQVPEQIVIFNPVLHIGEFCMGLLLARAHVHLKDAHPKVLNRMSLPAAFGSLSLLVACASFHERLQPDLVNHGLLAPIFCALILGVASRENTFTRLLSPKPLVVLGEASFGLYLIHIPVWHIFLLLRLERSMAAYGLYILLSITLSIAMFHLLEEPARRWIVHRFGATSLETTASSSLAQ